MLFKAISYQELWWPFVWQSPTKCAILVEEHFCEIILNLDQWFRGRCLKMLRDGEKLYIWCTIILAHRKRISKILPWDYRKSYLT